MKSRIIIMAALIFVVCFTTGRSQGKSDAQTQIEALKQEVVLLRQQLDSLKAVQAASDQSDEVDQMEERFDAQITRLEGKIDAISRAVTPTVLNPRTVAFINFAARHDNATVYDATGNNEIDNRPFLRTVELEMRAAVDPYAEAYTVISLENHAGAEFGIDAEEAYGLIKRLPIIESAPMGMKLRIGKFRAPLGLNNKIHMHDLPWTTRPLIIARYLGTEHGDFFEAGFNPVGLDADFYLPNPIPGTTLEMNLDLLRAGDIAVSSVPIAAGNTHRFTGTVGQPSYVGHINLSKDWENVSLLNMGLSTYQETGNYPTRIYGADLTYKWSPVEERESHSIVAGGETFLVERGDTANLDRTIQPWGWFGYLQYQTSYWLYLSGRYDWLKEPTNASQITRSMGLYASYYTTEFLRLRLGFEHRQSDIAAQDNINTILFDANFVFGSHPTEPYWVNR